MELEELLDKFQETDHIFLTGEGGSGKTTLTQKLINHCNDNFISVGITASTGLAARNLNQLGITLHSFLAIGLSKTIADFQSSKFKFIKPKTPLNTLQYLIIDEISMISADLFELIIWRLKANNFSGKILLVGDLFQLKPVKKQQFDVHGNILPVNFIFKSANFNTFFPIVLDKNLRVKAGNENFVTLLNRIRQGIWSIHDSNFIQQFLTTEVDEKSTILVATNDEALHYNIRKLMEINSEPVLFQGYWEDNEKNIRKFNVKNIQKQKDDLIKNIIPQDKTTVKVGARVLITSNHPFGEYVNGDCGEIIDIFTSTKKPQLQIKLDTGKIVLVNLQKYEISKMNKKDEVIFSTYFQFPIALGWSITIHKSQSLSIENLSIDCSRIFDDAMFYVAISRVVSPEKLKIINFKDSLVSADNEVKEFYNKILGGIHVGSN